jgi:hypothetical protein
MFIAMAQADNLAGQYIVPFYDPLKSAGNRPEFHIYQSGGHDWDNAQEGQDK